MTPPRPRDPFGRPLPPEANGAVEPDPQALPPEATLRTAAALLAQGRAFRAHEVFEATWKATSGPEREFWRGLAQLAVGITHAQRENSTGSAALLRRGAENLAPWEGQRPFGVPVSALRQWAVESALRPLPAARVLAAMPPLVDSGGG